MLETNTTKLRRNPSATSRTFTSGLHFTSRRSDDQQQAGRVDQSWSEKTRLKNLTVVIPAHNEESRIANVLETVLAASIVSNVIVVNDGSTDNTSQVARSFGCVTVIDLPQNCGKGGAMLFGAKAATDCDVILFFDGDLIHLKPEHVCALAEPVLSGKSDMAVGQFKGGRGLTDLAQKLVPYISGQRAIRRDLFLQIPELDKVGYGIEMAITFYVKYFGGRVASVLMRGVTHPMKEEKLGFFRGAIARAKMYKQMASFALKYFMHPPKCPKGLQELLPESKLIARRESFRTLMMGLKHEHKEVIRNGRSK